MAAIYYLFNAPPNTGGDRVAEEHVAALTRLGFRAAGFYCAPDQGFTQFSIPMVRPGTPVGVDDVLVLGEIQREWLALAGDKNCIRVLHDQAPYYTFFGFAHIAGLNAYPFRHVLVCSDHAANLLKRLGVTHPISRIHPSLPNYFAPRTKKLQIAYSPAKRQAEALFLAQYFKARVRKYAHVPWLPLANMSRQDCAKLLGESAIYAALPQLEGLGLMNLEAMASACHIVGYTGHGGAEYANRENGDWIADGDHENFVGQLWQACEFFESGRDNPKITAARATAAQFSNEEFEANLNRAWSEILGEKISLYRN